MLQRQYRKKMGENGKVQNWKLLNSLRKIKNTEETQKKYWRLKNVNKKIKSESDIKFSTPPPKPVSEHNILKSPIKPEKEQDFSKSNFSNMLELLYYEDLDFLNRERFHFGADNGYNSFKNPESVDTLRDIMRLARYDNELINNLERRTIIHNIISGDITTREQANGYNKSEAFTLRKFDTYVESAWTFDGTFKQLKMTYNHLLKYESQNSNVKLKGNIDYAVLYKSEGDQQQYHISLLAEAKNELPNFQPVNKENIIMDLRQRDTINYKESPDKSSKEEKEKTINYKRTMGKIRIVKI